VRESLSATKLKRQSESKGCVSIAEVGSGFLVSAPPARSIFVFKGATQERTRWDPKDGELCLRRSKPEETLVEDRSVSDVQIDRQT
jgi:hypothetical protein